MDQRSQGIRRHTVAIIALAGVAVLGGTVAEPVQALAAPTASGSKTKALRRNASPSLTQTVKSERTPSLPVGEARFFVPHRARAITSFRVWLDADLSSFKEVEIEVENLTKGKEETFYFALQNEAEANIEDSSDRVSIVLDDDSEKLHHLLTFDLHSDYLVPAGCSTSWNDDVQQETWSMRVSGKPQTGGDRRGIPLQRIRTRSYDYGDPCPTNVMYHVRSCIDPRASVVVQPTPGEVRGCALGSLPRPSTIKAP